MRLYACGNKNLSRKISRTPVVKHGNFPDHLGVEKGASYLLYGMRSTRKRRGMKKHDILYPRYKQMGMNNWNPPKSLRKLKLVCCTNVEPVLSRISNHEIDELSLIFERKWSGFSISELPQNLTKLEITRISAIDVPLLPSTLLFFKAGEILSDRRVDISHLTRLATLELTYCWNILQIPPSVTSISSKCGTNVWNTMSSDEQIFSMRYVDFHGLHINLNLPTPCFKFTRISDTNYFYHEKCSLVVSRTTFDQVAERFPSVVNLEVGFLDDAVQTKILPEVHTLKVQGRSLNSLMFPNLIVFSGTFSEFVAPTITIPRSRYVSDGVDEFYQELPYSRHIYENLVVLKIFRVSLVAVRSILDLGNNFSLRTIVAPRVTLVNIPYMVEEIECCDILDSYELPCLESLKLSRENNNKVLRLVAPLPGLPATPYILTNDYPNLRSLTVVASEGGQFSKSLYNKSHTLQELIYISADGTRIHGSKKM